MVSKGVLEAAISKDKSLYKTNHTITDVKKFLFKNNFGISKINNVDQNITYEKNIYFYNKKINDDLKINTNYNLRYFNRIISNKITIKDKLLDKIKKLFFIKY